MAIKGVPTRSISRVDLRRFAAAAKHKKRAKKPKEPKTHEELISALNNVMNDSSLVDGGNLVQCIKDNVVMLGSEDSFSLLEQYSDHIFCDGTFKYAPKMYHQMYTIHIIKENVYVPIVYFLLRNKKTSTYKTMFTMLHEKCPQAAISLAHFDFEIAARNAFAMVYPSAEVRGCRFHLGQAWYRKLASLGLQVTYNIGTSAVAVWLKTCFGMPCLPADDVTEFFKTIMLRQMPTRGPHSHAVKEFSDYLLNNYINVDSKFPPAMWAGCLDSADHKNTTNGCENFHRHFGTGCLNPHPSVYDWLAHLSMSHKRSVINSQGPQPQLNKKIVEEREHLKNVYDALQTNAIDQITFVKLVLKNMFPFSPKYKCVKTRAMFFSINRKYNTIVRNLTKRVNRRKR